MRQIVAKLRDASGVSMVLALGIMMVVSIVCVSTLKVASSAPRAAYTQQDLEQSYLAATSAAKLVKHIFDTDETKALQLLQEMDECSTNNGLDSGFSKEFQVQLSRTGVDATILNKFNMAKVTLTKTSDGTVTVSVSGSGYPASLSLPVETIVWQDNAGVTRAKTTYPNGYLATHTPVPPEDYDNGGFSYTYSGLNNENHTYQAQQKWKVLWIDGSGAVVGSTNCGVEQPETQPDTTSIGSITPQFSGFSKWDWEHAVVNTTDKTIIVPPVFSSTDSTYNEYRATWASGSNPTVTYSGSSYGITQTPTYALFALLRYTINWLDGDGTIFYTQDIAVGEHETPPSTNPTKAPDGAYYSYTFTSWNSGTMDTTTNVKTYTPQFTGATASHTVIWENGDGSTLDTQYYAVGGTPLNANSTSAVPTKAAEGGWNYDFNHTWDSGTTVGNVTTYKPQFTHTVKWMNGDGTTVLQQQTFIAYPDSETEITTFSGDTPTKTADDNGWEYTFQDWNTATFESGIKTYTPRFTHTVRWMNSDSSAAVYSEDFLAGATEPTLPAGYTPTKAADGDGWAYVLMNWDSAISGNVKTYTPRFGHPVRWLNGDGTTLEEQTFPEDTTVTSDMVTQNPKEVDGSYKLTGWTETIDGNGIKIYSPVLVEVSP